MLIRCIDFETAGTDAPDQRDEIIEAGWHDVVVSADGLAALSNGSGALIGDPGRPITPQARGVHHITDEELAGALSRPELIRAMCTIGGVPDAFCAHEARFERSLWTTEKRPWICTRKAALRIWPDAPDHKLQTLRYWLKLDCAYNRSMPPHRAGPDAYVGAHLLLACLAHETVQQLIEWTEVPSLLAVCPLKKHKGQRWEDVPDSYLNWMLSEQDMDEDLLFTAKHHKRLRMPKRDHGP